MITPLHEIVWICAEIIQSLVVCTGIKPENNKQGVIESIAVKTYLLDGFAAPRDGFAPPFGFFFPDVLSLCSFCFSFANVVKPLAALRTSTSRKGIANCRT